MFQNETICHSDYPESCIKWGNWISNSKPFGKFKEDIEHMDNLLAQTPNCPKPILIKCVTNGYETEVICLKKIDFFQAYQ